MRQASIDILALADITDHIYNECDGDEMPFSDLLHIIMHMRGTNATTVKDIVDLRTFIKQEIGQMMQNINDMQGKLQVIRPREELQLTRPDMDVILSETMQFDPAAWRVHDAEDKL